MKIVFLGTSQYAVPSLELLSVSDHTIVCVVTQPDKKSGRHLKLNPSPVKVKASLLRLNIYQPENINNEACIQYLKTMTPDLFVLVAYGQILSKALLDIPKKMSINLHLSLLPKYRGAAPVNWCIINGEKVTGVSVIKMTKEMDAGEIISQQEVKISDSDTSLTLGERLSKIGANLLLTTVDMIEKGNFSLKVQDDASATFAPKLKKKDGLLNWNDSCLKLYNKIRGLQPWPSTYTYLNGRLLKIIEGRPYLKKDIQDVINGQVIDVHPEKGILVKVKDGVIGIKRLQLEGSRVMDFLEFARGHNIKNVVLKTHK